MAYSVLGRPLPFREPDALVLLGERKTTRGDEAATTSYPAFEDWQRRSRIFASVAASHLWMPVLRTPAGSVEIRGAQVTQDFFSTLGLDLARGRGLLPSDWNLGATPVVVVSHRAWREQFGSDPALVGKILSLDGTLHTVVGVLPARLPLTEPIVLGEAE
ncbi:MAG: ABC transporter permease, partial [Acidobacteriota bacterium]|nr:ABC transporter permease [Acidobacteriota bacterium]